MKRFISLVLCLLLIPSSAFAATPEKTNNEANGISASDLYTSEPAMPTVGVSTRAAGDTMSSNARALWCDETASYLESVYGQEVVDIYETPDAITFEFDAAEELDPTEAHVLKVEYIKPEAISSSYQTKLTYMWGWTEDYYMLDSAEGQWGTVKDALITIAGLSSKLSVASMVASILNLPLSMFYSTQPVKAESTAKYYFLNKVGQLKDPTTGIWGPYAYVGSRRDFMRCLIMEYDEYGQPITLGVEETIGVPSNNPTNYDAIQKKANFDNDTWIINRAISAYENDTTAYRAVYGWPTHFSDTLP